MNLNSFHLLKEDQDSYTVAHPKGKSITVKKQGLNEKAHKAIQSMKRPNFDDGGTVAPDANRSPASFMGDLGAGIHGLYEKGKESYDATPIAETWNGIKNGASDFVNGVTTGIPSASAAPAPQVMGPPAPTQSDQAAPASTPGASPVPQAQQNQMSPGGGYDQIFANQASNAKSVHDQTANVISGIGADQAAYQKQVGDYNALANQHLADIQSDLNKDRDAYISGKIDPNHVWNSKTSGQKAATTIGIILAGIGSGLTGQSNAALDVMNKQIDRDIEGQKMQQDKSKTLYGMNLQRYGNEQAAENATRLQMSNAYQSQLQSQGLKMQGIQNNAAFQQANQQIDLQKMGLARQQAMWTAGQQLRSQQGLDPQSASMVQGLDPKSAEIQVPITDVNGTTRVHAANTPDDAKELKTMQSLYNPIMQDVHLIQSLGKQSAFSPEDRSRALGAMNRIAMGVNEFNGYKRFTDTDKETIGHMFQDPSAFKSLIQGEGPTADTIRSLNTKMESERANRIPNYKPTYAFGMKAMK